MKEDGTKADPVSHLWVLHQVRETDQMVDLEQDEALVDDLDDVLESALEGHQLASRDNHGDGGAHETEQREVVVVLEEDAREAKEQFARLDHQIEPEEVGL